MIKKVTLKRNLLPVVMFLLLSPCSMYNTTIYADQPIHNSALTKEDVTAFELVAENIKKLIVETQQTLEKFIDEKDKTPYASYISKFDQQMNLLETTIIAPLKQKMAAAESNAQLPSEYKHALKVTDNILTKVKSQISGVANILKDTKYNPANNRQAGMQMAKALQQYSEKLLKDYQSLDKQLDELHNYLLKLELVTLASTISFVRQNLKAKKEQQEKPKTKKEEMLDGMRTIRIINQKLRQK